MKERAKQPYEGLEAYEAGYMHGYDVGYADATEISNWYWDEDGTDYNIGA